MPSVTAEAERGEWGVGGEVTRQQAPETCPSTVGMGARPWEGSRRTGGGRGRVNRGAFLGAFGCQVSLPPLLAAVAACFLPRIRGRGAGHPEAPRHPFWGCRAESDDSHESPADGSGDPGDGRSAVFFLSG